MESTPVSDKAKVFVTLEMMDIPWWRSELRAIC